jgi:hypothetical protein
MNEPGDFLSNGEESCLKSQFFKNGENGLFHVTIVKKEKEEFFMHVHELKVKFFEVRNYQAKEVNELLDFAKSMYIHNQISISEYRNLVRELESLGAVVPWDNIDHSLMENSL